MRKLCDKSLINIFLVHDIHPKTIFSLDIYFNVTNMNRILFYAFLLTQRITCLYSNEGTVTSRSNEVNIFEIIYSLKYLKELHILIF